MVDQRERNSDGGLTASVQNDLIDEPGISDRRGDEAQNETAGASAERASEAEDDLDDDDEDEDEDGDDKDDEDDEDEPGDDVTLGMSRSDRFLQ